MPRVIFTANAMQGIERCRKFLTTKNQLAARRAAKTIFDTIELLEKQPEIGRPFQDTLDIRELMIEFGATGYIALYRYDAIKANVYVLSFRHQKEENY